MIEKAMMEFEDSLPDGWDWGIKIEGAFQCAWSAELRMTPEPNTPGPDRSVVLWGAGAGTPEEAVRDVLKAAQNEIGIYRALEREHA